MGKAPYTVNWTLDDGRTFTGATVTTSFSVGGIKTITAVVKDSSSPALTQTQVRALTVQTPLSSVLLCLAVTSASWSVSPVTFTANYSGGSGSPGFSWSNNVSGTTRSVSTSFSSPGTYTGTVLVTDRQNVSTSCSVTVQAPAPPTLSFGNWSSNPSTIRATQLFTLNVTGNGFTSMTAQICGGSGCWPAAVTVPLLNESDTPERTLERQRDSNRGAHQERRPVQAVHHLGAVTCTARKTNSNTEPYERRRRLLKTPARKVPTGTDGGGFVMYGNIISKSFNTVTY